MKFRTAKLLNILCAALATIILIPILGTGQATETIEAPKEFSLSRYEWELGLFVLACLLFIMVMVRIYNITQLTRTLAKQEIPGAE